ncbi:hypothetical protein [Mucilaginibacter terrae]|uniref:Uncharacterized protein n=1 Tax=Mucilaginibacter terrae TaxID=1955052 RepID=A0ABU3GT92_9SPHI|nr:hypothetical protein [Mucilaginibacter terrae]MDT3403005.1 hypothetical protein [Mucilaginibacter terrae]
MKYLFVSLFTVFISFGASAQTVAPDWSAPLPSKNIAAQVDHSVAVCDTVSDFRVVSPVLTLINIGGRYPNQNLTVAVKGDKIKINAALMKSKAVCFYGPVTIFKNKPEIVITEPEQIKDIKQYQ